MFAYRSSLKSPAGPSSLKRIHPSVLLCGQRNRMYPHPADITVLCDWRNEGVSCSWVMCSSTIQTPEWLNFDRLFLSYGPKIGSAQFYFVTARRFRRLSHLRECVNKRCDRCKPRGCYLSSVHVTDKAGNVINLSPFPFKLWHCFVIQPVLAANWWIFLKSVFDLIFFSYRRVQGSQWLIVFYRQRTTKKNKS